MLRQKMTNVQVEAEKLTIIQEDFNTYLLVMMSQIDKKEKSVKVYKISSTN